MTERPHVDIRRLLIASAASPINLGVLGVGVAVALALAVAGIGGGVGAGVAVLSLAVLAYGAMVGLDLMSPRFVGRVAAQLEPGRFRVDETRVAAEPPVPAVAVRPPELQKIYQMILDNYGRTRQAYEESSSMLRDSLGDSLTRCAQLVQEAGRTALKGNTLKAYLDSQTLQSIQAEAQALEASAAQASDKKAAESYKKAAASAREQLQTYQQIVGLYDRVRAQLAAIETSTDGVYAKIVKLQATDVEQAVLVNQSISAHLDALSVDIHSLESAVEETMQEIGA